jgi:predicted phage baseplate assembly protein
LRAAWDSGEYLFEPRLRGLLLNTIMGTQAVTITDEVLGSSNEISSQQLHTNRAPVLAGPQLYVREPELPPANEQTKIADGPTGAAIQTVTDATGRPQEIWVRWDQMPDFYGSKPRDRHYVLDNLTGEVRFGDGKNGLIPPAGSGNIRMSRYRTGGGAVGNKPAGSVTQLKTTVPYVQQVVNYLGATGGSEGETTDSLLQRASRSLRHGDRAVTVKDYEDLALLASTEVARARCVPLTDLVSDESARVPISIRNGTVSLIIVPRSTDINPAPGSELIGRVEEFVGRRHNPVADLVVTGPKYVFINVDVYVTPVTLDGAGEIKLLIATKISGYLHPLTGGVMKWMGLRTLSHRSNLIARIEALPGVDHEHFD